MKRYKVPIQSLIDHIKTAMDVDPWAKEMAEELLKEQETMMQCIKEKCRICPHCTNCDFDENCLLKEQKTEESPADGCWNCIHFDWNHEACTLNWNNMDESYYNPDADDRKLTDHCDEWENDLDADPECLEFGVK